MTGLHSVSDGGYPPRPPRNSLKFISEVQAGLRLTTIQLGRARVRSRGRALSAGRPPLNEIASWEVNVQPAL